MALNPAKNKSLATSNGSGYNKKNSGSYSGSTTGFNVKKSSLSKPKESAVKTTVYKPDGTWESKTPRSTSYWDDARKARAELNSPLPRSEKVTAQKSNLTIPQKGESFNLTDYSAPNAVKDEETITNEYAKKHDLPNWGERNLAMGAFGEKEEKLAYQKMLDDIFNPKPPKTEEQLFLEGLRGEEEEPVKIWNMREDFGIGKAEEPQSPRMQEFIKKHLEATNAKQENVQLHAAKRPENKEIEFHPTNTMFHGTPFESTFASKTTESNVIQPKKQDPLTEIMSKYKQDQKNKPDEALQNKKSKSSLSAKDAAQMAKRSYAEEKIDFSLAGLEDRKLGDGWVLIDKVDGSEGLVMHIYARGHGPESSYNGPKEYVIVNKGTSSRGDWINNAQQIIGFSTDMHESIAKAKAFVEKAKSENCKVTFVGHSKGGAEAAANAIATNSDAILFNPAELSAINYRPDELYTGRIHSYVVAGDAVDIWNKVFAKYGINYKTDYLTPHSLNPLDNHSIDSVIEELDERERYVNEFKRKVKEMFK